VDSSGSEELRVANWYEYDNELSNSIKGGEFLE
jgi:hypothetical protein